MAFPILWFGLLFGFRHALEADHVAAVASLATRSNRVRDTVRIASAWGLGHASVLLLVGAAVASLGLRSPASFTPVLETIAGVLLVVLGIDVLLRLRAVRKMAHVGAAAPSGSPPAALAPRTPHRAFFVGGVHGMAGSAALTVAVVPSLPPGVGAIAYLSMFGLGSIAGMVVCSLVISLPLRAGGRKLPGAALGSQLAIGALSVGIGCWVAVRAAW